MKTHPGVLTTTPSKAQTNESDPAEDRGTSNKISAQQEEKQGLAPEKGDSTALLPTSGGSDVTTDTMDTTT